MWNKIKVWYETNPTVSYIVKLIKYLALIALVIFAIIVLFRVISPLFTHKSNVQVDRSLKPTTSYVDKNGTTHNQIQVQDLDASSFRHETDSLEKLLKGRASIKTVTQFITRTDTIFRKIPVYIDTSGRHITFAKNDNYITLEADADIKDKVADIRLSGRDTLTYTDYVRKHLFKSNEHIVDITNKNPYIKVTAGNSINLKEPKVLVTLGPQLGYNPLTQKLYYGLGITYNIISLKTRK